VRRLAALCDQLSAFVCAFLIVATTAAVIVYQLGVAISWLDDLLRMLLVWLVYFGTVSLCLDNDHIAMDAVYLRMSARARRAVDILVALLGIALCAFTAKVGFDSLRQTWAFGERLSSGEIPAWTRDLAIPLCCALMTIAYLSHLAKLLRR
jgi:TRAP-type C4-dicarboxylate transport system permease small subunit